MRKYSHNLYLKVFSTYQTTTTVVRKHLIYHKVLNSREVFQTSYTSTHEQILRSTDTRMCLESLKFSFSLLLFTFTNFYESLNLL